MSENKGTFYWLKLRLDFFDSPAIDFLFEQENGSEYVALYLKICAMVANTNGILVKQINEIQIPYDVKRIAKDAKYFSIDTVGVALELYKKLGLILEEENGLLKVAEYEKMVGSSKRDDHTRQLEAERQRKHRARKKLSLIENENIKNDDSNVTVTGDVTRDNSVTVTRDVTQKNRDNERDSHVTLSRRDKRLEIRDKEYIKRESIEREKEYENLAHSYGKYKNVILSEDEYEELLKQYGDTLEEHITILDEYIERTGKTYKSCYLAVKKWVHDAYLEQCEKKRKEKRGNGNIKIEPPQYMIDQKNGTLVTHPATPEELAKLKELQDKMEAQDKQREQDEAERKRKEQDFVSAEYIPKTRLI